MRSHIALPPDQLAAVRQILRTHLPGREVRAFGSRVTGRTKPASDLDLCIMEGTPLAAAEVDRLRTAFAESDIPIKVDIVEWAALSDRFRSMIEQRGSAVVQDTH